MSTIDQIKETVTNSQLSVKEAVAAIMEETPIKTGMRVAILDDNPYALDGLAGKVKGPTANKTGWFDVELPNRMVVPCQANLLLPC